MNLADMEHPDEETLEKYLRGSLGQTEAQGIEQHLLVCQSCVKKAVEHENYLQAMHEALRTQKPRAKAAGKGKPR